MARARVLRGGGAMLAVAAAWSAIDLPVFPIVPWDEARLAVNALEMRHTGWSLVTTYGFRPDLWNTKPPLMIWLMNAAMAVFGPHAWAMRLPSVLATLGSAAIVMALAWRVSRSALAPLAAGFVLLTSRGFVGRHCGATADYDALLCFWVTAYAGLGFTLLHRRRPPLAQVLLLGALIGAAGLTKGVAGFVPGVGLALYALLQRRLGRVALNPAYMAAAVLALGVVSGFYLAREAAAPGYLRAVGMNEFGRYAAVVERHDRPPWYYLVVVFAAFGLSLGLFAAPLLYAARWLKGRRRAGALFGLCLAGGVLGAYSLGATKIGHYADPAYPFLALACGLGLEAARDRLRARLGLGWDAPPPAYERAALWGGGAVMLLVIFLVRDLGPAVLDPRPQGRYGAVFAQLARRGVAAVEVRDTGLPKKGDRPQYAPQLQVYALIWAERGLRVIRASPGAPWPPGGVVASCDPVTVPRLAKLGPDLGGTPGCYAVAATGSW